MTSPRRCTSSPIGRSSSMPSVRATSRPWRGRPPSWPTSESSTRRLARTCNGVTARPCGKRSTTTLFAHCTTSGRRDGMWDWSDNTYSDGRQVMMQVRVKDWENLSRDYPFNALVCGDGAINEHPRASICQIAPVIDPHAADGYQSCRRRTRPGGAAQAGPSGVGRQQVTPTRLTGDVDALVARADRPHGMHQVCPRSRRRRPVPPPLR